MGDIVLVHDDCKRIYWKLVIVESLIYGKDNLVRAANIRTAKGPTNRAVTRLYPLEITADTTDHNDTTDRDTHEDEPINIGDPEIIAVNKVQRDSARCARVQTKLWCDELIAPPPPPP